MPIKSSLQPTKNVTTHIRKACEIIKDLLGVEGKVIKARKGDDNRLEVELEVVEESDHMKKIGIGKPVYDKHTYIVVVNADGELESYERKEQQFGKT